MLGILEYCCVHSGACAPGSPNASPLATISVAMYNNQAMTLNNSLVANMINRTANSLRNDPIFI